MDQALRAALEAVVREAKPMVPLNEELATHYTVPAEVWERLVRLLEVPEVIDHDQPVSDDQVVRPTPLPPSE